MPNQAARSPFKWTAVSHQRPHGRPWQPGDGRPRLGEVIKWLGRLGGHLGRKSDPSPGAECLSKALYALDLLLQGRALGRAEARAECEPPETTNTET